MATAGPPLGRRPLLVMTLGFVSLFLREPHSPAPGKGSTPFCRPQPFELASLRRQSTWFSRVTYSINYGWEPERAFRDGEPLGCRISRTHDDEEDRMMSMWMMTRSCVPDSGSSARVLRPEYVLIGQNWGASGRMTREAKNPLSPTLTMFQKYDPQFSRQFLSD
jgi:hypothetical protein